MCGRSSHELEDFDSGTTAVVAPNHSSRVLLAKDGSFRILRGGDEIRTVQILGLSSNIDVVWSPDSEKFSITYSSGGAEGAFHAHVYRLGASGIAELSKLPEAAFEDFKKRYFCSVRGNNIYALGWTKDSKRVFFVTQVYPTGDCGKIFGRYGGYLVDLDGNIVLRYGDKQTEAIQNLCWKSRRAELPQVFATKDSR